MQKLHTLWELMRTVDVVGSHDDDWELERLGVGVNQHLSGGLGSSIWVGWGQNAGLEEIIILILDFTVNLIGGDVDEALDANLLGTLEQNVSTVNVGVGESVGVSEAQINVGLSSKVENGINVIALEAVHDLRWVGDVSVVKGEVSLVIEGTGVVQ